MIVKDEHPQILKCTLCGELAEVKKKVFRDPDAMLEFLTELRKDHKDCEKFKDDPDRARIERVYKVRMRCEVRRSQRRS